MNATDHATLAALQDIAIDGVAAVSNRRLAEKIGRSAATANKSLRRLIGAGTIRRVRSGRGLSPGRYRVPAKVSENQRKSETTMTGSVRGHDDVPDIFRSRALYGAGQLHMAAPKGVLLTRGEILLLGVAKTQNTIKDQLVKLESMPIPLVESMPDPTHSQRLLWKFNELTPAVEEVILEALEAVGGRFQPTYRIDLEHRHLLEQEMNFIRLGLKPWSQAYDQDVLPRTTKDVVTGCLLFDGDRNTSEYGTVHPEHMGIGVHRIAWYSERGPVPSGHEVHHLCRQRRCVNVEHLQVVTKAEHTAITMGQGLARRS